MITSSFIQVTSGAKMYPKAYTQIYLIEQENFWYDVSSLNAVSAFCNRCIS